MMRITSQTGTNSYMQTKRSGGTMQMDSTSKSIQNQIANAKEQLEKLSANEDMKLEEKMKKRQEIQQEIASLNQQLRQHQVEQRKQQSKSNSMDDLLGAGTRTANTRAASKGSGLSQANMQAMISADSSRKQAKIQGGMATKMEGKANVLKAEIQTDKGRGANTEAKEAELAELEQNAANATQLQNKLLANANQQMEEAAKTETGQSTKKLNKTETTGKTDKDEQKTSQTPEGKGTEYESKTSVPASTEPSAQISASVLDLPISYKPVDIRL